MSRFKCVISNTFRSREDGQNSGAISVLGDARQ
jgi:hypothetical protein